MSDQVAPVRSPKVGIPDGVDLEGLSLKLGDSWKEVGRRLDIPREEIVTLDRQHQRLRDKGHAMLQVWTQMFGSKATYKKLYDALSHEFVKRQDLAEKFCLKGASDQEDNILKDESATEKQPLGKAHASACGTSGKQRSVDEVIKPSGTTEDAGQLSGESAPLGPTPRIPASTSDQEIPNTVKMSITPVGLSSEQEDVVDGLLRQQLETFLKYNKKTKLSTANGLSAFLEHLEETYNLAVKAVGEGSLVIKAQCPDLESLESLWSDYRCGVLNEAAERFLVTDEIKNKINLETLRLKTLIEKENYLNCKKALMETSGATDQEDNISKDDSAIEEQPLSKAHAAACGTSGKQRSVDEVIKPSGTTEDAGRLSGESVPLGPIPRIPASTSDQAVTSDSSDFSPSTESGHEAASLPITIPDVSKDKKQVLDHVARAEKAKASRGSLHKAAISGQCETVKMLLESGEDVDQRDQFSLTPLHLACWYGQESVVKLLLEPGANVNAEDRFQRTPLQKAGRQNHHSIVQLLLRNYARPCLHQPVSLKKLSRKAFLQVDKQSGFNLLQAAVFEGDYYVLSKVHGLLDNFVEEMEVVTTGSDATVFPRRTAVDILSLIERRQASHDRIEQLYCECAKDNRRLTELQWDVGNDDAEQAVEVVLNEGVDINAPSSDNDCTPLFRASISSSSQFIKTLIDLGAHVNAQRTDSKVTPLLLAAYWNNYMASRLFLWHGTKVNVQDRNGFSPLHSSVLKNHETLIKLLLSNNADVNIQDKAGATPLLCSVTKGDENLVRLLLEHNADVNIQDNDGQTPLHRSVSYGNENLVRLLLEHKADVNIQNKYHGQTPLHWSVRYGYENLVRLLLEHNADVNIQDKYGKTPLHWSVRYGYKNLVRLLLEHNADVNIQSNDGQTPLHWSVRYGYKNLVRLLLEHNADVNIQDKYHRETPLHWSVKEGDENLVRLLLEHNAHVNIQNESGQTPLHWSVKEGDENLVRLLLEHKADVNIQNKYRGETPLHLSVRYGYENLVRLLLEHNVDVNIQNESGETPLHWSVKKGDENLVRLLLEHNAHVNIQDKYLGETPLHLAASYRRRCGIIDLLVKPGTEIITCVTQKV